MKSFTSVVAILAAFATSAVASPVPEAAAEAAPALEARADVYFTFWTEIDFKGTKSTIKNPTNNQCYNLQDPFQDTISSAGPTKGLACVLWENTGCNGNGIIIRNPGVSDLRTVNFNDKASSYSCNRE